LKIVATSKLNSLKKYIEFLQLVKNFFVTNNFVQDFLTKKEFFFQIFAIFAKINILI